MATYTINYNYLSGAKENLQFLRKENLQKFMRSVKSYTVNTAASISFNFPVGLVSEVLLNGMSFQQSMDTRKKGAMISLISGAIFTKYRDGVYRVTNTSENSNNVKRAFIDTVASLSYGLPMYAFNLASNGASKKQIITAMCVGAISSVFTARPYGMYLDFLRTKFGTKPEIN